MPPAQESLDSDHLSRGHAHERLVAKREFVSPGGVAQFGLEPHALLHARIETGRVETVGVASPALRFVYGEIGVTNSDSTESAS